GCQPLRRGQADLLDQRERGRPRRGLDQAVRLHLAEQGLPPAAPSPVQRRLQGTAGRGRSTGRRECCADAQPEYAQGQLSTGATTSPSSVCETNSRADQRLERGLRTPTMV